MHLCVIGTGAAGWMAAHWFNFYQPITQITVIGSPETPPIGVGESNTLALNRFHEETKVSMTEFVIQSDATVKTGVYYKGWSKHDFIHNFKGHQPFLTYKLNPVQYWQSFGNKPTDTPLHDLYGHDLLEVINNNHIFLDSQEYPISWHFDAGKYIQFLSNVAQSYGKIKTVYDTITSVIKDGDTIRELHTKDGKQIVADYYIFATGQHDVLDTEYISLSDTLLTDKAWIYPLPFTNKREQFTPYTQAKTMPHGWRWITPTQSRVGTGYVFSSRHVSPEEARDVFIKDVGQPIEPRLVDFIPRYAKDTFHENYCTIGMANGFLEPLDAPGLSLTINTLYELRSIFLGDYYLPHTNVYYREKANDQIRKEYEFWASFIITQYKTSTRSDTQFWIDHKNVHYQPHQDMIDNLYEQLWSSTPNTMRDMIMFTMAAKDVQWDVPYTRQPFMMPPVQRKTMHHLDYIDMFYTSSK